MSAPSAKLLVLVGEKFSCIKIVGRANFNSSVDFKTLVNELRAKGYGYSLRDRLIAGMPHYAPWAARVAPLLNLRNRIGVLRWVSEKLLGFAASRDLPLWRRDRFDHAARRARARLATSCRHLCWRR